MGKLLDVVIRDADHWFTKLPAFPKGHKFFFDPKITWIAGRNVTGKSVLLKAINVKEGKFNGYPLSPNVVGGTTTTRFFDTEMMNPRTSETRGDTMKMYQLLSAVAKKSHGQTLRPIISMVKKSELKGVIAFIDEPEAGISPWEQKEMLADFIEAVECNDVQIVAATHSIIFLQSGIGSVLDLNSGPAKLIPATEYKLNL